MPNLSNEAKSKLLGSVNSDGPFLNYFHYYVTVLTAAVLEGKLTIDDLPHLNEAVTEFITAYRKQENAMIVKDVSNPWLEDFDIVQNALREAGKSKEVDMNNLGSILDYCIAFRQKHSDTQKEGN